jgi:hypothetical protein
VIEAQLDRTHLKVSVSDVEIAVAERNSQISEFTEICDQLLAQKAILEPTFVNDGFSVLCETNPLQSSFVSAGAETDLCEPRGSFEVMKQQIRESSANAPYFDLSKS